MLKRLINSQFIAIYATNQKYKIIEPILGVNMLTKEELNQLEENALFLYAKNVVFKNIDYKNY